MKSLPSPGERQFHQRPSVGNTVLADDGGLIGMEVTAIEGNKVICKVLNNGDLGENKGVNLPGVYCSAGAG